jgi:two-component system sensor histidine kinase HydH
VTKPLAWQKIPSREDPDHKPAVETALTALETQLIVPCQEFRLYNGRRIEQSTIQHESVLSWLAWGMTGIGILRGIAGLVLGFGLTHALGQSIRRLQVRIRDAAGKLGPELPEIILTGEGQFSLMDLSTVGF